MTIIITIISYVSNTCIRYRHGNINKLKTYKCKKFTKINKLINSSHYVITKNKQINDIICPNSNINKIFIDTISLDSKLLYCTLFDLDYDNEYDELDIYQNLFTYFFKNSLCQDNLVIKFTKQKECLNNIINKLLFDNYNNLFENDKSNQIIKNMQNEIDDLNKLLIKQKCDHNNEIKELNFIICNNDRNIIEYKNKINNLEKNILEKDKDLEIANETITKLNNKIINFKKINNDINFINKKYDKIFYLIKEYTLQNEILETQFLINNIPFIIKYQVDYKNFIELIKNNIPDIDQVKDLNHIKKIIENLNNYSENIREILDAINFSCIIKDNCVIIQVKQNNFEKFIIDKLLFQLSNITNNSKYIEKCCCICFDNQVNILLFPCRHAIICDICINSLNECPLCRKIIRSYFKIFI